jgi:hypothetical protein
MRDLGQYDAVAFNSGEGTCKASDMRTGIWTLLCQIWIEFDVSESCESKVI